MKKKLPDYNNYLVYHGSLPSVEFYTAEVTVDVPDTLHIPPLPYKKDNKLLFPVGIFSGVYNSIELRKAIEMGVRILDVKKVIIFPESGYFLKEYVSHIYPLKAATKDDLYKNFYKIMLNSLYGKFAMATDGLQELSITDDGEIFFKDKITQYSPAYVNVIWSSFITSYARIHLLEHLLQVEYPLYCDTDSIFFAGKKSFKYSAALGGFKSEGVYDTGEFYLPKFYTLTKSKGKDIIKIKGIPYDFQSDFLSDFYLMVENPDEYNRKKIAGKLTKWSRPLKYREALRRGMRPNQWVEQGKEIQTEYDKRIILEDGSTYPIKVDERYDKS
jgi:hypothetical protein